MYLSQFISAFSLTKQLFKQCNKVLITHTYQNVIMTHYKKGVQDGRKSQKGDFYVLRKPENVVRVIYELSHELITLSL